MDDFLNDDIVPPDSSLAGPVAPVSQHPSAMPSDFPSLDEEEQEQQQQGSADAAGGWRAAAASPAAVAASSTPVASVPAIPLSQQYPTYADDFAAPSHPRDFRQADFVAHQATRPRNEAPLYASPDAPAPKRARVDGLPAAPSPAAAAVATSTAAVADLMSRFLEDEAEAAQEGADTDRLMATAGSVMPPPNAPIDPMNTPAMDVPTTRTSPPASLMPPPPPRSAALVLPPKAASRRAASKAAPPILRGTASSGFASVVAPAATSAIPIVPVTAPLVNPPMPPPTSAFPVPLPAAPLQQFVSPVASSQQPVPAAVPSQHELQPPMHSSPHVLSSHSQDGAVLHSPPQSQQQQQQPQLLQQPRHAVHQPMAHSSPRATPSMHSSPAPQPPRATQQPMQQPLAALQPQPSAPPASYSQQSVMIVQPASTPTPTAAPPRSAAATPVPKVEDRSSTPSSLLLRRSVTPMGTAVSRGGPGPGAASYTVEVGNRRVARAYPGPIGRMRQGGARMKTEGGRSTPAGRGTPSLAARLRAAASVDLTTNDPVEGLADQSAPFPALHAKSEWADDDDDDGDDDSAAAEVDPDFDAPAWRAMLTDLQIQMPSAEEVALELGTRYDNTRAGSSGRVLPTQTAVSCSVLAQRTPSSPWCFNSHFLNAPGVLLRDRIPGPLHVLVQSTFVLGGTERPYARMKLKDPFGVIDATLHSSALRYWGPTLLRSHTALQLRDVVMFHAAPTTGGGSEGAGRGGDGTGGARMLILTHGNLSGLWDAREHDEREKQELRDELREQQRHAEEQAHDAPLP